MLNNRVNLTNFVSNRNKNLAHSLKILRNSYLRSSNKFSSINNNSNFIILNSCQRDSKFFINLKFKKIQHLSYLLRTKTFVDNIYTKMCEPTINYFAHTFIDRCSDKRKDHQWISEKMKSSQSVFILFHADKPFVSLDKENNRYSLYRFGYSQVEQFLIDEIKTKSSCVFLGLEYERVNKEANENGFEKCLSPYSNPAIYNREVNKAWFALDTSVFDPEIENVSKMFPDNGGKFFEGNFLRLMAINDSFESSIVAQVRLGIRS